KSRSVYPDEQTFGAWCGMSQRCHEETHAPQQTTAHSITSSARASSVGGMMTPSAFAVFRLITSSNLVGCSTGRSAGFAPLKILSTKLAALRQCHALDER